SLTGDDGLTLLPKTRLQPDTRHRFVLDAAEVSTVRLDVFPDGGVGRLRLYGAPTEAGRAALLLRFANALPDAQLAGLLGEPAGPSRPYPELAALPGPLLRALTDIPMMQGHSW
ncbi:MAG TPA: hypothetical protein VFU36_08470, partial [Jatrophihabitans sp.]|nr:hypothetical protein [Jatrophihabitans sp.]